MSEDNALPTPTSAEGDRETVEADLLARDSRRLADARPASTTEAGPIGQTPPVAAGEPGESALPNPSQAEGERSTGPANAPGHQQ
jgi:hypothetical protein